MEQRNWTRPSRREWIAQIGDDVAGGDSPVILVAHSLGCLAVAQWAAEAGTNTQSLARAFLVAPPWLTESDQCPGELADFLPMPLWQLPFPSYLLAVKMIRTCPSKSLRASAWGSEFINIGRQGHINVASGHGAWPEGESLLREFVNCARVTQELVHQNRRL